MQKETLPAPQIFCVLCLVLQMEQILAEHPKVNKQKINHSGDIFKCLCHKFQRKLHCHSNGWSYGSNRDVLDILFWLFSNSETVQKIQGHDVNFASFVCPFGGLRALPFKQFVIQVRGLSLSKGPFHFICIR